MQELQENNKILINLIYLKQEFSEKELFDEFFKQRNGNIAIESTMTIRDYLCELTDFGILSYENGLYCINNRKPVPI